MCELTPFPLPQCFPNILLQHFSNLLSCPFLLPPPPHLAPLVRFLFFPHYPPPFPGAAHPLSTLLPSSSSAQCLESSHHCCRVHLRIAASKDGTLALSLGGLFLSLEPPPPPCPASRPNQGCLCSNVKPGVWQCLGKVGVWLFLVSGAPCSACPQFLLPCSLWNKEPGKSP